MFLEYANVNVHSIHDIVLVGGSTRIPKVQQLLHELFLGKNLICKSINPDEAVAYGAAIQAAILSGQVNKKIPNLSLLDITPLSLGWSSGNFMHVMVPRNSTIPLKNAQVLTEPKEYQTGMVLKAYEGESLRVSKNNLLGKLRLSDIPPAFGRVLRIEVCIDIDANGISNFSAVETSSGKNITIKNENGRLSEKEIERLIQEVEKLNADDEEFKKKVKAKNDLENYAYKVRKKINNSKIFPEDKKNRMLDEIEETIQWLLANDAAEEVEYMNRKKEIESLMNREKQVRAEEVEEHPAIGASPIKEENAEDNMQEDDEEHSQMDNAANDSTICPNDERMAIEECVIQDKPCMLR